MMRNLLCVLMFVCAFFTVGCGSEAPTVPMDQNEMQAYIDEHPEMNITDEELNSQPEPGEEE